MAFLNKDGVERLWLHIVSKLNKKVDKIEGKGLSTNDYTTEEKEQLATLGTLVGNTTVTTQINEAVANITSDSLGALNKEDYYGLLEKEGAIISAESLDGAGIKPTSYITAIQTGEGDASLENIRPINGWETIKLTHTGRNLISHLDYTPTNGNKATVITEDLIDLTSPATYDYANIPNIHLKGGITYTLYVKWEVYNRAEEATGKTTLRVKFPSNTTVPNDRNAYQNGVYTVLKTYTPVADEKTSLLLNLNYGSSVPACSKTQVMLLEGAYTEDTIPTFEPCNRQILTLDLPDTIYGGSFDWMTGVLTVTHGQTESYANEELPEGWISSTGALTEGAQVIYPLNTPNTIQLTPQQLKALQGVNTVWSDCGDTRAIFNYSLSSSTAANLSEVLPVANGGTGATTAVAARENLLMIVSEIEPTEPVEGTLWFDIS